MVTEQREDPSQDSHGTDIAVSSELFAPGAEIAGAPKVEQISISDDGMRIVVSCYRQGIVLASRHPGDRTWTRLHPNPDAPYSTDDSAGDMTHVAISRDGRSLAWGAQSTQHFCNDIGGILGNGPCRAEGGSDASATCCSGSSDPPCLGRDLCCPTETMPCP